MFLQLMSFAWPNESPRSVLLYYTILWYIFLTSKFEIRIWSTHRADGRYRDHLDGQLTSSHPQPLTHFWLVIISTLRPLCVVLTTENKMVFPCGDHVHVVLTTENSGWWSYPCYASFVLSELLAEMEMVICPRVSHFSVINCFWGQLEDEFYSGCSSANEMWGSSLEKLRLH